MKRLLVFLLLCLSKTVLGATNNTQSLLEPDLDWYVNNIRSDVYHISTANELAGLSALVNGTTGFFSPYDFSDKTIVLSNDIDLGCTIDENGALIGAGWEPIGQTFATRFAGTFDGHGYCITGMIIKRNDDGPSALFGYNSGTIKNLIIAGGYVISDYYGASICSHNSGTITHCISTANIYCNNYGGGICGKNYEDGTIKNCFNFGFVSSKNKCGGIVGSNDEKNTLISNCIYDNQMCPLKNGCGTIVVKTIKGLSTRDIINQVGYLVDNNFVVEHNRYPRLTFTQWTPTTRAALTPLMISESQDVMNITRDIEFEITDSVSFISSNQQYLNISNNIGFPKEKACVNIYIKGGSCHRTIGLRITNDQLRQNAVDQNPLRIANYEDLLRFANAVNYNTDYNGYANINGFNNCVIVLTDNITMPDDVAWEPIGTITTPFSGIFRGYGFCVSNMKIAKPGKKFCGLFGYSKGKIEKIVLVGGHVIGGDYTGSICGYNDGGLITKCINAVNIHGHYYTGGIAGYNNAGTISQVINVNNVEGIEEYTGGICGETFGGSIENAVYDTQMSTTKNAVAIAETNPTIINCKGLLTNDMIGNKLESKDAFSFDFQYEDDMYPKILSVDYHSAALVASTPVFVSKTENIKNLISFIVLLDHEGIEYKCTQPSVLKLSQDKALPLRQGSVTLTITDGNVSKKLIIRVTNPALEPSGTEDSPLLISSYSDIDALRNAVNFGGDYKGFACIDGFKDVHFKITNNIVCPSSVNQTPIGNYLFPFKGILDGNNFSITSFNSRHEDLDNIGFIGFNSGTIKNLVMSRSTIIGRYYSGGVVGYNTGRIEKCSHDSASVNGSNYAGGIAGYSVGTIALCKNIGAVKCDYYSGGITGSNTGRIDSCTNTGLISGMSGIGGISGSNSAEINYCTNTAVIQGTDNTGGISGRNVYSTISLCQNYGRIIGGDCAGGISGVNDGTIIKCNNDSCVSAMYSAGGIAGKGGKIIFCQNNSTIQSSGNNAGGITGGSKNNSELRGCINRGHVKAQAFAGGVCGDNIGGKILSSVSFGFVDAAYYTGGICGNNNGSIVSCIAYGNVRGSSYTGSICGRQPEGSTEKSFYNLNIGIGGIENSDIPMNAQGLTREYLIGDKLKNYINNIDFIFTEDDFPLPKTE